LNGDGREFRVLHWSGVFETYSKDELEMHLGLFRRFLAKQISRDDLVSHCRRHRDRKIAWLVSVLSAATFFALDYAFGLGRWFRRRAAQVNDGLRHI
jgi:hypothetical protein